MVALLAHPETRLRASWDPRVLPAPRVRRVLRDRPDLRGPRASRGPRALLVSALAPLLPLPLPELLE